MALMRPITRDLAVGGLIQFFALLFAACILDMGGWATATADISVGFWVGVVIVILRRHNSLTEGDHTFLRFGLVPLLIVGIPITLGIWAYRGVI